MKRFNYGIWKQCYFKKEHYENNNIAISVMGYDDEFDTDTLISVVSVNTGTIYPEDTFVLKNYSENEDANELISLGFFEIIGHVSMGYVICPIVKILNKFKDFCEDEEEEI